MSYRTELSSRHLLVAFIWKIPPRARFTSIYYTPKGDLPSRWFSRAFYPSDQIPKNIYP